ncbi:hemicentin-1-like isoform X29 [Crassostrea virginica]
MACDIRTLAVLQGSFLIPVLFIISCFHGIYSQSSGLPGNPLIAGEFEKNEGELVTLSCTSLGGNPLPSVRWFKGTQLVDAGSSPTGYGDGQYTVGSSTVTYNNYTFTVSRSDNLVNYVCQVENSQTTAPLTRVWTISIYVPSEQPIITGPEPAITTALNAGSTYKYVCTARNGRPAPVIRWKLGTSLSTAIEFHQGIAENTTTNSDSTLSKTSSLSWVPITDDNGKNLYCQTDQTTAGSGTTQKSTFVSIVVQQIPILSIGSSSYTVQVGGTVTLACSVLSATPAITTVFWRKLVNGAYTNINIDNIRFFGGTVSNANLTITNVVLSDQTSYQCSASNSAGTGNSGATTLTVSGSAPLVQIDQDKYPSTSGNTVTLVCDVYSSLTVTDVYWERTVGGQFTRIDVTANPTKYGGVTISSPSLVVRSVTTGDAGQYRCVAVNIAGTGQDETTLEIQGNLPRVTIEKDSYSVNEGNTVTLACTVLSSTSTSVVNVSWQTIENGVSSTLNVNDPSKYAGASVSNPSLTIFNADSNDNGQYRCTATNTVGTGESAITTLKVIAKPTFRITQDSYTVNYGSNVTLQVTISSPDAPILAINWQHTTTAGATNYVLVGNGKYDGATVGSPSLRVLSSTFDDEGTYRCLVTSSAGSTTSGPISLTVIGNVPSVVIGSGSAVVYGGSVTITCSISSNPIAQTMYWQKTVGGVSTTLDIASNPRFQGGTLTNPSLTITSVTLDDRGEYRCFATNIVGTGQSGAAVLEVTGDVPTVTTGSGSTVYIGDDATITCLVSGTPPATAVSWQYTTNSNTTTINLSNTAKYSGGSIRTPSLTIFNVSKADEGSYRCQATNIIGTGQSVTSAFLSVIGSVPVAIIGPDISVTVGDRATISCSVTGYPLSTAISWLKIANGVRTNVDVSQARVSGGTVSVPSLTITSVETSDEGDYQCSATNILGTSQSGTAYLDVLGSIPSVQIPSSSYSVAYGSQIRLQCVVNSIPPATSIEWRKTYQGVTTTINFGQSKYSGGTITDPSLRIFNADLSDEASYVCSATNIVGSGSSRDITLSVVVSLPTVQVGSSTYSGISGSSVTLVCSIISSNPSATSVKWEKDVNGVRTDVTTVMASRISGGSVNQPSLTISSLTGSDSGTYYCSAANAVGTGASSATTLTVQNRPTIILPAFTYNANFGQDVTLQCNVTSVSTLTQVTWRKYINGSPNVLVVSGSAHYSGGNTIIPSLTIHTLSFSDSGNYDCSATNIAGTSTSSQMTLNVIGTVPSVNIQSTTYSVTYGGTVTLECVVNSSPFQTSVEWQRIANGVSTTIDVTQEPRYSGGTVNSPSLIISGAVSGDAGVYVCSATNDAGKGVSGQTVLTVQGNLPQVRIAQSQYSILYGGSVYMECTVENAVPPVTSLRWYKGPTQNNFNSSVDVTASRFSGGTRDNPSLNITNALPLDEGYYACNATNLVGSAFASTFLDVYGDFPSITLLNTSYSVMVGSSVTIACDYSSSPAPNSITWQRIQNAHSTIINVLDSRYGGGTVITPYLTIHATLLSDAGVYTCSVTNQVGTSTSNPIFLFVNGSMPSVSIPQSTYNVNFGDPITIPCNVTAVPIATNVSWVKTSNGVTVTVDLTSQPSKYSGSTVSNPNLTISSTDLTDEGNYVCSASNIVGTGSSNAAFLDVIGDVPSVSVSQTSYSIFVGSSVTMNCFVSGNPAVSFVYWSVTRNGFTQTAQDVRYSNGNVNNPSLTISNARQSDSGVFVCVAQNSAGTTNSSAISLTVSGSTPTVTMGQSSYSVFTNGDVTLSCSVSANPSATISWTFTSNTGGVTQITTSSSKYSLSSSTTASSLTVRSANSNDQGSYVCSATNSVGTGQATATLVVSGSLPTLTLQSTHSAITGNDIVMTCSVSANPAVSSVSWQFQSSSSFSFTTITSSSKYSISSTTGTSSLTVRSVASSDNGQYRCQATNQVGTSQSTTTLTVSGSVPTVNIPQNSYSSVTGQDVQIPCSVSANPSASISWTFTSTTQSQTSITSSTSKYTFNPSSTDGTLRVRATSSSDSGTYRCQATNAVGTSSDSATLSVTGTPPSVNFGSSTYSVVTGQSTQLSCFVSATPSATAITWTFQSNTGGGTVTITSSSSGYSLSTSSSFTQSTLTVLSAQNGNGGTYTCTATNLVGTRSASASLSVSGSLPSVNIPNNIYSSTTGQDVSIPCSVSASPSATISWTFISNSQSQITISSSSSKYTFNPTSTDGTLTVRATSSSDSGTYRCQATNAVGTSSDTATLSVTGSVPSVNFGSSTYTVVTGQSTQLSCFVSATPSATAITWTFQSNTGGGTVTITSSSSGYSLSTTSSFTQSTLTVLSAQSGNGGTYTCTATNLVGTRSASASLSVSGSLPSVTIPNNLYTAITGQDVSIPCSVSASPSATISWIFISNSQSQITISSSSSKYTFNPTSTDGTLTVRATSSSDSGTYRCQATNAVGTSSDTATLSVSGSLPTVTITQSSYSVITGSNQQISCFVNANPTATSITWTFRSSTSGSTVTITSSTSGYSIVTSSTSQSTLTVLAADNNDEGTYTCQATNQVGNGSDSAFLDVTGSRPVVDIAQNSYTAITGNNVVIPCTVSASPAATSVSWTFTSGSGSETTISTSSAKYTVSNSVNFPQLTILSVVPSDSGTYRCSATNVVGTNFDTTSLSVTGSRPVVTIPSSNYNVVIGNSITLPCTISASPSVTATSWLFTSNSNTQIQITASNVKYTVSSAGGFYNLTVNSATSSDAGVYECRATNAIDTSTDSARLDVSGSIPVVTLPVISYQQTYGQNVTIQCSVTATPAITSVLWQRLVNGNYVDITTQSSTKYYGGTLTNYALTITNLVFTDNGEYRCTATNQVGRGISANRASLQVLGTKPSVVAPHNSYTAVIGTNVSLACVVSVTTTDPPVLSVDWKKATPSGAGVINVSGSPKYSGSTTASPSLFIQNLDIHDNGNYSCLATNAAGTSESNPMVLTVTGSAPTPNIPLTTYSVLIGNNVEIPCSVSATPAVTSVQWQFTSNSGNTITITQSTSKYTVGSDMSAPNLTVNSAALSDAGSYACSATNIVGTGSDTATLTITGIIPNVTIPDTSLSVQKRQNITITCNITDALPKETSVLWEFRANQGDSGTIISIDANPTKYLGGSVAVPSLTILSVAAADEGYYTCVASNVFGEGRSELAFLEATGNAATVTVSPASQAVIQKNTATITCTINNANPAVIEVTWEKVSSGVTTPVTVTGRFNGSTPAFPDLVISDLQPSDAGTYYCSARNAIGTIKSSPGSVLQVTGAVPSNVQISGSTSRTVTLGGSLTLQCSALGDPSPTLTWFFRSSNANAVQVGTGTTYGITNAQRTNGGTYICRATNSLGSLDSNGVNVDVQYAPLDVRTEAQKQVSASVGSTVTLVCEVDSNPSASYQWYRSNVQVSSQKEYTFSLSSLALLGSYTCRASNSLGTQDLRFTVSQAVSGNTGASTVSSGLSTGEIAAIVLAVLLLLILIIIIIICCLTHGACGVICGKKQDVKGRVEPTKEKEVYRETQKEVIIPRFHEESIKGKSYRAPARAGSYRSFPPHAAKYRQPSAVSRKDVDVRVQNGGFRRENDYEIVRYETVPAAPPISTQYITESPRPHHLPALSYTYEDVEKKRKKRRKKKKHHHRRHHGDTEEVVVETVRSASPVRIVHEPVEEVEVVRSASPTRYVTEEGNDMVVERVIRSRSASPTRIIRTEAEHPTQVVERVIRAPSPSRVYRQEIDEPVDYPPSPHRRRYGYYDDERIIETRRSSSRSPQRYRQENEEEMIIEQRRSPSTRRRHEENYITEERYSTGDDGDLRAVNGVVYREAPSRHSGGQYTTHSSGERRSRSRSGRRDRGSDDDLEVVYGKEYVVER